MQALRIFTALALLGTVLAMLAVAFLGGKSTPQGLGGDAGAASIFGIPTSSAAFAR